MRAFVRHEPTERRERLCLRFREPQLDPEVTVLRRLFVLPEIMPAEVQSAEFAPTALVKDGCMELTLVDLLQSYGRVVDPRIWNGLRVLQPRCRHAVPTEVRRLGLGPQAHRCRPTASPRFCRQTWCERATNGGQQTMRRESRRASLRLAHPRPPTQGYDCTGRLGWTSVHGRTSGRSCPTHGQSRASRACDRLRPRRYPSGTEWRSSSSFASRQARGQRAHRRQHPAVAT